MRILSIDGGGVRGIVPASTVACWETELKFEAPERFDLFTGTSTGAIVAASLALGLSARKISLLFQDRADEIFSRVGLKFTERALSFKGWAVPAYTHDALRETLLSAFGEITMGDCPRPLSIPCLDVVTSETRVFRSAHFPLSEEDRRIRVADAVIASAAAPSFFPSAQIAGSSFIDGSMWASNPAMLAMLDCRDLSGSAGFEEIRLVSLGCGRPVWGKPLGFGARRGLVGWGAPLVSLMLTAQSDGIDGYVRRLLPQGRYLRVNPQLPRAMLTLDNVANIPKLMGYAAQEARSRIAEFQSVIGADFLRE